MASKSGEADRLAKTCEKQGFRVKRTTKGYLVLSKDGESSVLFHRTPSDPRATKNNYALLRRIGVQL